MQKMQCPIPMRSAPSPVKADALGLFAPRRLAPPSQALRRCVNLAPAATGTGSLTKALSLLRFAYLAKEASSPGVEPVVAAYRFRAHHNHDLRPANVKSYIWEDSGTRCFILTLRDPAERLESAMRHDVLNKHPRLGCSVGNAHCLQHWTAGRPLSTWIRSLANVSDPGHRAAMTRWHSSRLLSELYFLRSQTEFLVKLECAVPTDVHVLCTQTLDSDWDQLVNETISGLPRAAQALYKEALPLIRHEHRRAQVAGNADAMSRLSAEERYFVRRCMYPADTALFRTLCEQQPDPELDPDSPGRGEGQGIGQPPHYPRSMPRSFALRGGGNACWDGSRTHSALGRGVSPECVREGRCPPAVLNRNATPREVAAMIARFT